MYVDAFSLAVYLACLQSPYKVLRSHVV